MSVRALRTVPVSYFRSHTRDCLVRVSDELEHVLLTAYGKPKACLIPWRDTRVLWQLQDRPVKELEDRLRKTYARWRKAKALHEGWTGTTLDEGDWRDWDGFKDL